MNLPCGVKAYDQICTKIRNARCEDKGVNELLERLCMSKIPSKLSNKIYLCICDRSACPDINGITCGEGKDNIFDILTIIVNRNKRKYREVEVKSISELRPENIRKSLERIELKFNTRCCDYVNSSKILILSIKSAKKTPGQVKKEFKRVLEEKGIQNIEVMLVEESINLLR
jgi:protein required for attachment to host cells